jgi:hypothetical protein
MLRLKRVEAAPCPSERCTKWARMAGALNLQEASEEEKLPRRWDDAILGAVIGDKKQKTRLNMSSACGGTEAFDLFLAAFGTLGMSGRLWQLS